MGAVCQCNQPLGDQGLSGDDQHDTYISEAAAPGERKRHMRFYFVKVEFKTLKTKINDKRLQTLRVCDFNDKVKDSFPR